MSPLPCPPRPRRRGSPTPLFGLVAALLVAGALPLTAQEEPPETRTLAVSGEGSTEAPPDRARLRVGVLTEAPSARAASEENARRMSRVVEALRAAGVPEERIQTVQLTVEPAYDYADPEGRPRLRGFQARNLVEAVTDELERLGAILDAVIEVGGNTVEGVVFELEDPGAAQAAALADAVADARRKAEALARAAGVRLGEVRQISATYGGGPIPVFAGPRTATLEARADAPPPVSPGELTVTSNVQVVYRIE